MLLPNILVLLPLAPPRRLLPFHTTPVVDIESGTSGADSIICDVQPELLQHLSEGALGEAGEFRSQGHDKDTRYVLAALGIHVLADSRLLLPSRSPSRSSRV